MCCHVNENLVMVVMDIGVLICVIIWHEQDRI